jgi:hypothetical protein
LPEPGPPARPAEPSRCTPASSEPAFWLGTVSTRQANQPPSNDEADPSRENPLPFASEVGDGVAWSGGFAVGALHEVDAGLGMALVTMAADGRNAHVIALGGVHGDVEPPKLAARGDLLVAGLLEPDPTGRSLRLAKIQQGKVTWGATLHERASESQAFDIALGEKRGVAVWDEEGPSHGVIVASTFEMPSVSNATAPRVISPSGADVESPRLLARAEGGYWLAYIARAAETEEPDARASALEVGFRWIEVVPLDVNGSPSGAARAVTPKDGHVLVFDLAPADGDAVLLVFRSDEAPIGSSGGQVIRTVIRPSAAEPPVVLVDGDEVGAGVPSLLDGWLAVTDAADVTRLAPIRQNGELAGALRPEPEIGSGEPIAGQGDRLLVARPAGRAIKLLVLRCKP